MFQPQQSASSSQQCKPVSESHSQSKVFEFEFGEVHYNNVEELGSLEEENEELTVNNFLAYQNGNTLIKITEIMIQNKILRIRDEFKIVSEQNQKTIEHKNIGIFGRRNNYTDASKKQKSDTKNLIKNISNLFTQWLRTCNTEISERATRRLNQIFKKMKYFNKHLIQELCGNRDICLCFLEFGRLDSELAIESSRINDKPCHLKAMRNYVKLFEESLEKLEKMAKASPVSTND